MRFSSTVLIAAIFVGAAWPARGHGQLVETSRHRSYVGISGSLARPVGEFQQYVDWGGGLDLYALVALDPRGAVGLRVEGSLLIYGHESFAAPLSPFVSRITLDVDTDNLIFALGTGPQLSVGWGPFRYYVYGTAGFSYFATISSVSGTRGDEFASTTNYDDVTLALAGGGGMLVTLSRGRHPVALDLSVKSTHNGEAAYLRPGGIRENQDGSLTVLPIRSEANLLTFRAGIAVGL